MKKITLALLAGLALSMSANAVENADIIKFRKSTFQVVKWNFGNLAGMAKGEIPYNKEEAEASAKYLESTAKMSHQAFVKGSYVGETKAKPEIESNAADFEKKYTAFVTEIKQLAEVADDGVAALKGQVGKVGGTCKSCHDAFRKD